MCVFFIAISVTDENAVQCKLIGWIIDDFPYSLHVSPLNVGNFPHDFLLNKCLHMHKMTFVEFYVSVLIYKYL